MSDEFNISPEEDSGNTATILVAGLIAVFVAGVIIFVVLSYLGREEVGNIFTEIVPAL